jgi:putative hydrolase of the HAD superfamily
MRWEVARDLSVAHGLPPSSVFETLYATETWRRVERGRGDIAAWLDEAHQALEARAGRALPPLHAEWRAAQSLIGPALDLASALRPRYKVSVLSNADRTLRRRLEEELCIAHLFDDIVCSAEVGMAKPEAAVFHLAAERLGVPPARCVFVDDWDRNVEAAEAVGMEGVLHRVDRGHDLRTQLAAVGVRGGE